jgi:hypothetical protein
MSTPTASRRKFSRLARGGARGGKPRARHATPGRASVDSLDCCALIDESLTRDDWKHLFHKLLDSDHVQAAALLLRYRFSEPGTRVAVLPIPDLEIAYPQPDDDVDSTPGPADQLSQQSGG